MKQLVVLFFISLLFFTAVAQQPVNTVVTTVDTVLATTPTVINKYEAAWQQVLQQNKYLNTAGTPYAMPVKFKKPNNDGTFFYILFLLVLVLALLKFFYSHYFNTLFRVFFNTSLRQGQLTDQLVQLKLPSLMFNIFFVISTGTYVFFLLRSYQLTLQYTQWFFWGGCILATGIIYFAKYSSLKFTGWVTGHSPTTDNYVFIIFLINKIIGVVLLPFTILLAFADAKLAAVAALVSLLFTALLFLLRFFRSYGLLQNQLSVSRLHFFLYLAGIEIIPLLLIYKWLMILLQKNM